jgi:hypothetical protein
VLCDFKLALRFGICVPDIAFFHRCVMRVGPFLCCLNNLIVFQNGPSLDFSLFDIQQMLPKSQFALVAGTFVGMGCLFFKGFHTGIEGQIDAAPGLIPAFSGFIARLQQGDVGAGLFVLAEVDFGFGGWGKTVKDENRRDEAH